MRVGAIRLEQLGVTISAAEQFEVEFVTEDDGAEIRNPDGHFLGQMASGALGETESAHLVMALAAGLPLLHLRHGYHGILRADLVN